MGLPVVRAVVRHHHGLIELSPTFVNDQKELGLTVTVRL